MVVPDDPHVSLPYRPMVVEQNLRIDGEMTERIGGDIGRGGDMRDDDASGAGFAFPQQQAAAFLRVGGPRVSADQGRIVRTENDPFRFHG